MQKKLKPRVICQNVKINHGQWTRNVLYLEIALNNNYNTISIKCEG